MWKIWFNDDLIVYNVINSKRLFDLDYLVRGYECKMFEID